jgi:hypothetical protein
MDRESKPFTPEIHRRAVEPKRLTIGEGQELIRFQAKRRSKCRPKQKGDREHKAFPQKTVDR